MVVTPQELGLLRSGPLDPPPLPRPRGPLTAFLFDALQDRPGPLAPPPAPADDPLDGDDSALALYCCYELHYRGFAGVDDRWEWEAPLLAFRGQLEERFAARLAEVVGPVPDEDDPVGRLHDIAGAGGGPSLSRYLEERGRLEQLLEFSVHRSAYQLKEADPHSWALPRLAGASKAALVEIQADEYGQGVQKDMHAELFALSLRELGLDAAYGAYVDVLPGVTLATVNLVSYFGLHRRWRGALVGHLAMFEMTSVEPMGRYSVALGRHGFGPWARLFYDVHVVADAHHQTVAARDLAGGLVRDEPHLRADVVFGALAVTALEGRFTDHLLGSWAAGRTSLLAPLQRS
ncbi:MAG TPA: iron-containing redox enzyme family protein [Egibacteraceae bacterium]|nr:iron-containing redox enzyme family protein [Egibacteraceae bacterium]